MWSAWCDGGECWKVLGNCPCDVMCLQIIWSKNTMQVVMGWRGECWELCVRGCWRIKDRWFSLFPVQCPAAVACNENFFLSKNFVLSPFIPSALGVLGSLCFVFAILCCQFVTNTFIMYLSALWSWGVWGESRGCWVWGGSGGDKAWVLVIPRFVAGKHKVSLKVSYFWISHYSVSTWPSCGFIHFLSCFTIFPVSGRYWAQTYTLR